MRYGIIGTGWIAEAFIEGARLACGADIAAVYSRTAERGEDFARRNGIAKVYTDINELAAADVDGVYIASPNALHYEQSKLMLSAGKHVICEKPITVEPEELIELQALAAEKGLVYIEAIMYMHNPVRELLRETVGRLGKVTSAHFDFSQLSSKYPAYKRGELPNIFNPALATGGLMDLGIYCVYPAVDLFGIPDDIAAKATFLSSGADGAGSVIFNYADKVVTFTYSKLAQDRAGSQIFGDEGTLKIGSISKLTDMELIAENGEKYSIHGDTPKAELMGNESKAFERFIAGNDADKYALSSEIALQVSRLMKRIRETAGIHFG